MDASRSDRLNVNRLYDLGIKRLADQHEVKEVDKRGILRAGNTGVVANGGEVIGTCARQTLLRFEGIKYEAIEDSKRLMFDAVYQMRTSGYSHYARDLPRLAIPRQSSSAKRRYPLNGRPLLVC